MVDRGGRFPWQSGSRSRTGSPGPSFWPASVFASRRDSHTDQLADDIDHVAAAKTDQQAAIFRVDFDVSEARENLLRGTVDVNMSKLYRDASYTLTLILKVIRKIYRKQGSPSPLDGVGRDGSPSALGHGL